MTDCSSIWINRDLYDHFTGMVDPKRTLGKMTQIAKGTIGTVYKTPLKLQVPNLLDYYIVKTQPVNPQSNREKKILEAISSDMLAAKAPLLFPFMYSSFVQENTLYFIMQPAHTTLDTAIKQKVSLEWWVQILYQIAKAVYYLEENKINHNDLTLKNIMFQEFSTDYKNNALMLIDFGSAVQGHHSHDGLPAFVLGRDLNYFLYTLIFSNILPAKLAEEMRPLIAWEKIPAKPKEQQYLHGLRRANIVHHNWKTSGKNVSRTLAQQYPFVTDRCNMERLKKIYGVGFGAIIGDAFGMPLEFDHSIKNTVKKMHCSDDFKGLLSGHGLPEGTFTDDTQMALALIDAITSQGRKLVPSVIAKEFKAWVDSEPLDVGTYTATVFLMMEKDGSNWEQATLEAYKEKPYSAANGATMRVWPIPILLHFDPLASVIDGAIKQAKTSHMNPDAVYASVFVAALIHHLINGEQLKPAITACLKLVKDKISPQLYDTLSNAHTAKYNDLKGGTGWIVHTMSVVMWSLRNTNSFKDAIIKAANVRGDTDTNASITGAIAGALYGFDEIPGEWLEYLNVPNEFNKWNGMQMTVNVLKDKFATLAQC